MKKYKIMLGIDTPLGPNIYYWWGGIMGWGSLRNSISYNTIHDAKKHFILYAKDHDTLNDTCAVIYRIIRTKL